MTCIRWIGAIGGLLLVLGGTPVVAQSSADAFFHEAAQQYVGGEVEAARRTVQQGLDVAPSDPRLLALRRKLRQEGKRSGGRSSQQGQQGRQQNEQSRGSESSNDQRGNSTQDARSRADGQTSSDGSTQRSTPNASSSGQRGAERTGQRAGQGRGGGRRAPVLGRAQAMRLLRALENQEKKLLREVRVRSMEENPVEKDW